MKAIICFFKGHNWNIKNKTTINKIVKSLKKELWWMNTNWLFQRNDFEIIDKVCDRCGKELYEIEIAKIMLRKKLLKNI